MVLELLSFALPNFTTDKCALLGAKIRLISKKNFPMLREAINLFEKSCHYRISDVADFTSVERLANCFVAWCSNANRFSSLSSRPLETNQTMDGG